MSYFKYRALFYFGWLYYLPQTLIVGLKALLYHQSIFKAMESYNVKLTEDLHMSPHMREVIRSIEEYYEFNRPSYLHRIVRYMANDKGLFVTYYHALHGTQPVFLIESMACLNEISYIHRHELRNCQHPIYSRANYRLERLGLPLLDLSTLKK